MDLLALADFTLVARHGGFGKAARAAHRPKATLSRRVAELEAALDLRLFERGRRDLKLTEEGRALYERAGALLTELEETAAAISSSSELVRGRLRISALLLVSQTAMGRLAPEFARRHPEARLEVTTDDRTVDMIEEGYDLVIRVDPAADDALVGRPFLHDRLVVVAAPDTPRAQGGVVPAVVRGGDAAQGWAMTDLHGTSTVGIDPVLRLSSLVMIRDAVRAGAGVARLPLSPSAAISPAGGSRTGATLQDRTSRRGRCIRRAGCLAPGWLPSSTFCDNTSHKARRRSSPPT